MSRCAYALLLATALCTMGSATPLVAAQAVAAGPCPFVEIDLARYGRRPFQNPTEERSQHGRLKTTLAVSYTDPLTTSIGGCPVTLRTYNGQLVGPTLRMRAGETLELLLTNRLPREQPPEIARQVHQQSCAAHLGTLPHSYNTTNLHTHGLHVSPVGNSDNVLLAIPPQTEFRYEIKVPSGHPAGTFWYHAHTHGSTAIQVGSGMAGTLIIEDESLPAALREATRGEKILVFQTILYDTHGRVDHIAAFFPGGDETTCKKGSSACTWKYANRRITVNGQLVPVLKMRPGEVQRWRLVDSAFRETINVRLEGHALHEIALDGLYLGRVDTWGPQQNVELQPGYRSDVLVKASASPGTYRLVDSASSAATGLRGVAEDEHLLAELVVEGEPLDMSLPTSAEMQGLAPFPGVELEAKADGVQEAVFKIGSSVHPRDKRNYFQINYQSFNPSRIRYLKLGATDMWSLTTVGDPPGVLPDKDRIGPAPHVFHIHVNPFQVKLPDPSGQKRWVWKDTLLVAAGQTLQIYTRYLDYVGRFVMHCHILDHEDLGMMEVVEVVGDEPAQAPGHGHRRGSYSPIAAFSRSIRALTSARLSLRKRSGRKRVSVHSLTASRSLSSSRSTWADGRKSAIADSMQARNVFAFPWPRSSASLPGR